MKFRRTIFTAILSAVLLFVTPADAQQPREQGPPPDSCQQAERENTAMRDRIASLERQVDATNEEAKTFYLRASHLWEAYAGAIRLADHYRAELARERARNVELEQSSRRSARGDADENGGKKELGRVQGQRNVVMGQSNSSPFRLGNRRRGGGDRRRDRSVSGSLPLQRLRRKL